MFVLQESKEGKQQNLILAFVVNRAYSIFQLWSKWFLLGYYTYFFIAVLPKEITFLVFKFYWTFLRERDTERESMRKRVREREREKERKCKRERVIKWKIEESTREKRHIDLRGFQISLPPFQGKFTPNIRGLI